MGVPYKLGDGARLSLGNDCHRPDERADDFEKSAQRTVATGRGLPRAGPIAQSSGLGDLTNTNGGQPSA
jgi:hypothetical protein